MKKLAFYVLGLGLMVSCSGESEKIIEEENTPQNQQQTQQNNNQENENSDYEYVVPKTRFDIGLSSLEQEINESVKLFDADFIEATLASTDDNVVISPLGMNILLSMLVNGADNSTLDELMAALNCSEFNPDSLSAFIGNLSAKLADVDNSTTFKTANAVWAQVGYPVQDTYIALNKRFLQADFSNIDFGSDTAATVINDWCKKSTEGLIERLDIPINSNWVLLLADALYFKGQWERVFSTNGTVDDNFTDFEGNTKKVKFMKQTTSYRYLKNESVQMVEIPYGNRAFSMYVAIPEGDLTVDDCVGTVVHNMDGLVKDMSSTYIALSLPKFETEFSLDANDILSSLGISSIFDKRNAHFGRLSYVDVYVDLIKQQSVIKVTESGTEAAAVTYGGALTSTGEKNEEPQPLVVKVNKPFLYVIRETSTGAILFAGKVNSIN